MCLTHVFATTYSVPMKFWFLVLSVVVSMPLSSSKGFSDQASLGLAMVQLVYESEDKLLMEKHQKRQGVPAQYSITDFKKEDSGDLIIYVSRSLPQQVCRHKIEFKVDGETQLSKAICR